MVSRTSLSESVRNFRCEALRDGLAQKPVLLGVRDPRGRTWLHLVCATPLKPHHDPANGISIVDLLLALGLEIDDAAFTEGTWRATPLWYSIAWGRNLPLAEHLLKRGCNPDYCLFAAVWNEDLAAIGLLIDHGARVDDDSSTDETPLFGAVGRSKWAPAEALLKASGNADFQDSKGRTALHLMLKKGSAPEHFEMFVAHGARGDLPDGEGRTAIDLLTRKRDPIWHEIAARLATA